MRYGHSHGGIIGITLQPETLKIWALGLHIRSRIVEDMIHMSDHCSVRAQETHKKIIKIQNSSRCCRQKGDSREVSIWLVKSDRLLMSISLSM